MDALWFRRIASATAAAALLIVISWVDVATGYELQFFVFYFLPISLAAWHVGRAAGVLAAALCAATWLAADVHSAHTYPDLRLLYWNTAIRLCAFVVIALSIGALHASFARERVLRAEVQKTLDEVKQLRGLLPICSSCKRIRNDQGVWAQVEAYVRSHSDAQFTHGVCPECIRDLYPNVADKLLGKAQLK
jgi:hypothetical protein